VILGFFRFIFYLFIAYVIYLFLRLLLAPRRPPRRPANRPQPSGVMVKDETCNTYLPREEAILEKVEGKEYYFCSQECRKKFLEQVRTRD
jgi:YHS domain-containing protein